MGQDLLRIATETQARRVKLSVAGDLDISTAPDLVEQLAAAVQSGPAELDVDLQQLDCTDSIGLSVFVTAHFQCIDAGVRLRFLNPNRFIRELLAVTGLEEVLSTARTDDFVGA